MRRKLLSLALTLVMCLALAVPAMAAEVGNGKCTYELSNTPVGTVEIAYQYGWNEDGTEAVKTLTVYVVPDNTTVTSKTVPNGKLPYDMYDFEYSEWLHPQKFTNVAEPFTVVAVDGDLQRPVAWQVFSEDLNTEYYDPTFPQNLDGEESGICVIAESAVKAVGLTIKPYAGGTTPSTPETPATPVEQTPSTGFTDVKASDYFATPVAWAIEKEITNGTGNNKFSSGENCTNAQILTFLWRAYGKPEPTISNPFTNTIPEAYTKAAIWAYEKGMVSGTTFDVDGLCSRALAVTYMWQAAGCPTPATTSSFTDVPVDAAFATAVSWAVENAITTGTSDTTFAPNDICTRGHIVTFLHRNLA